jgi:membrane-associated protein
MGSILDWLTMFFRTYGIPVLGGTIILQCGGIPTGANYLVIAAGAFAYAGEFSLPSLLLWVWFFNIAGDSLVYWFWKRFGQYLQDNVFSSKRWFAYSMGKSARYLNKYGQASLLISRFPLSGLGPPLNILTGLINYSYSRFLVAIIPGELLWTGFNLGAGFWFGDAWETIGNIINDYLKWIVAMASLLWVLYMLYRTIRRHYLLGNFKKNELSESSDNSTS